MRNVIRTLEKVGFNFRLRSDFRSPSYFTLSGENENECLGIYDCCECKKETKTSVGCRFTTVSLGNAVVFKTESAT